MRQHNITLLAMYCKTCKKRAETSKYKFYELKGEYRESTGDKIWDVSEAHEMGHWDTTIKIMLSVS